MSRECSSAKFWAISRQAFATVTATGHCVLVVPTPCLGRSKVPASGCWPPVPLVGNWKAAHLSTLMTTDKPPSAPSHIHLQKAATGPQKPGRAPMVSLLQSVIHSRTPLTSPDTPVKALTSRETCPRQPMLTDPVVPSLPGTKSDLGSSWAQPGSASGTWLRGRDLTSGSVREGDSRSYIRHASLIDVPLCSCLSIVLIHHSIHLRYPQCALFVLAVCPLPHIIAQYWCANIFVPTS